jgi:hypothetical protein
VLPVQVWALALPAQAFESGDPNLSLNIDSADTHAIVASAGLNARFVSL